MAAQPWYIMCFQNSYVYLCTIMAEGGYDPTDPTTEKTPLIPGDNDDDDDDTGTVNPGMNWDNTDLGQIPADPDRTQPFEPGTASTPAGGESILMTTRTRLPAERGPLIEETSFGGDEPTESLAWQEIREEFEMADESKLKARYKEKPRSGGAILEVSMKDKKKDTWYPLFTKSRGDNFKTLNKSLTKEIQTALGKSLTEQFDDTNAELQEKQNEFAEKQKELEQSEQRAAQSQKLRRDMDALTNQIRDKDARMRELEDTHGPLNTDAIQRLKNEKKALEGEKRSKQQELAQLRKLAKQDDKIRTEVDKIVRERRELETRKNKLAAKKDALKPLDELKQQAEELETRITEDKRVIEDENISPSERAAAEARVAENEAALEIIKTEIEVRERQRPLLERVKDIFKKYGWTLQAVALAVGVVLSALALAGLNGLKAGTKSSREGAQSYRAEAGLPPARAHRLDRELYLQSRRPGFLLSGRARLAAHPCCGGIFHGKAAQEEA